MKTRTIAASEFKAKCLGLFDELAETGDTLIVTKRGRPVAKVVSTRPIPPRVALKGSVRTIGDILAPVEDWNEWSEWKKFE